LRLKTFTATTMADALAKVKRELGADAVILHTRAYKRGGVFGFGMQKVVEITAADDAGVLGRRKHRKAPAIDAVPTAARRPGALGANTAGDLIRRTYAVAQDELNKKQARPLSPIRSVLPQAVGVSPMGATKPVRDESLVDEVRAVKRMVRQMVNQQRRGIGIHAKDGGCVGRPDVPDKLFDQYLALLEQQVAEELAEEVIQEVRGRLTPTDLEDESAVRRSVLEVIAELIPADESNIRLEPPADARPRTIALIGPTGVGKTTTIAKLAATFKLKQKKTVGLITLDTYRIAAVDQLRTYANIIGLALHVVASPDELTRALHHCAGCDVILIDTAGRSQRDDPKLNELRSLISVADPHEVHLVLSSTCSQAVLMEVAERFSSVRVDRIIFTKLDEAVSFGVLLNVVRKVNKRLSYVTTGQEVPHHIEPGSAKRLAALVLGE